MVAVLRVVAEHFGLLPTMRVTDSDRTGLYRWADPVGYRVWAQHVADRGLLLDAMAFRRDGIVPVWAKEALARGCLGRGGCPLAVGYSCS